jgi:hypothetical protein
MDCVLANLKEYNNTVFDRTVFGVRYWQVTIHAQQTCEVQSCGMRTSCETYQNTSFGPSQFNLPRAI